MIEPQNMTVIINIQTMSRIIGNEIPFNELEHKSYEELSKMQEELIPEYNQAVKK